MSGDDSDENVMTFLNDAEHVVVKLEAAAADVSKLSATVNDHSIQMTSGRFCLSQSYYFNITKRFEAQALRFQGESE